MKRIAAGAVLFLLLMGILSFAFSTHKVITNGATAVGILNDTVVLDTTMGNITIELFDDMPITTGNFENLTQLGIYDGTLFFRVVPDFVIEGGDASAKGIIVPQIPDELPNKHSNVRGSVAMGKTNLPNSATSIFFINLNDTNAPFLDPNYSVFGRVVGGMDILDAVSRVPINPPNDGKPVQDVTILKAQLFSARAKVLRTDQAFPWYIDPAVGSDLTSVSSIINLYDPLVFPNNVGNVSTQGPVKPWIATNWTTSANGLTWTFTIRQDVTFHSGRTLNASDVAFSMNRLLAIGQGFAPIFEPYVSNATATDQWTVIFNMKKPFAPFLTSLVELYIVDSTTVTSHIAASGPYGTYGDYGTVWLYTNDAGSGPFTVKQDLPDAYLNMTRFSDYWGYVAPLAPTEYDVIAQIDPTTEYTTMLNKEAEISSAWLPEQTLDSLANVSGIYIANTAQPAEYYYMMNVRHPPLDDVHVRKALAYCLDYQSMVSDLYSRNTVATSCVPACVAGYANTTIYHYNVTAAEAELKQSKYYPDIINNPDKYAINFYWILEVPIREQDALFFAADAQAIGLKVNVIAEPWVVFVSDVANPNFSGMASVEVGSDYPEAGSLLASRYSSKSMGTWTQMEWLNDSTFDSMLETALSTLNTTQRYTDYAQLQQYIIDLCVGMNICDVPQVTAVQSYVKWPMAQDPSQAVPIPGYNYDGRLIEIESRLHTVSVRALGIGSDFSDIVVTIDGTNYTASDLPASFVWEEGSSHSFSFASPLNVNASYGYCWWATSGLSSLKNSTLTVTASGNVTATFGLIGDINHDGTVSLADLVMFVASYGSRPGDSRWNPECDIAPPCGVIGLTDLVTLAMHYGQPYP